MKTSKFNYVLFGVVALASCFIISCSKERINSQNLNSYNSPNSYLDSKQDAEQEFTIDSAGTGPIIGNQGTKIWTGKNCLMMPNGDSITYPFKIKLVELYTPKSMIYFRMPTVAGGNVLETDGEIRLRAFKGATELLLRPGGCYAQIEMPNVAPKNYMRVHYGYNPTTAFVDYTDNATLVGAASASLTPLFTPTSYGYLGQIGKLGWIDCGVNGASSNSSILTFTSTTDDLTNVAIFIYVPASKTVIQSYNLTTTPIPNNSAIKIVAIAVNASNQLYFYNQNLTLTSSQTISVTMNATTDASLTSLLSSL